MRQYNIHCRNDMRIRLVALGIALGSLLLGLLLSGVPLPELGGRDRDAAPRRVWIIKFSAGHELELGDDGVLLRQGAVVEGWSNLDLYLPGAASERLFRRPRAELDTDRLRGEARTGRPLPDLSLYARITVPATTVVDVPAALAQALGHTEWIVAAYPEPAAEPASLEYDTTASRNGAAEARAGSDANGGADLGGGGGGGAERDRQAPDFTHGQGYLRAAPEGVGAAEVWGYPGGRGASVRIVDVEGDWNWEHSDLPAPLFAHGTSIPSWRNHGTAVVGQLVARDDGHGIVGICPDAEVGSVSFLDLGVAAAIDLAAASVDEGDVVLIELHAPGPAAPEGPGQFGYLPMEFWQDCYDAIAVATANGRIVVEAAGNGSQNLDDPRYLGLFDRTVRDSGAILVGAGTPWGLEAEWFTNRGSRIDLHGWGSAIVSTGYGTLWGGDRERDWYTAGFGGTSGAAPIVAGSVAILQSMSRELWGVSLDPWLARDALVSTGTPAGTGAEIGPRPDLVRARNLLVRGVADVRGHVLDPAGDPIALAEVELLEDGRQTIGGDDGRYRLSVRTEPLGGGGGSGVTLRVSAPGFEPSLAMLHPRPGGYLRHDVVLTPLPRSVCGGRIAAATQEPLDLGTTVVELEAIAVGPVGSHARNAAPLGADLSFELGGLPRGEEYWIVATPIPGRSAAFGRLHLPTDAPDRVELPTLLVGEAETFESGAAGWSSTSQGAEDAEWILDESGALSGVYGWRLGSAEASGYGNGIDVSLVSPSIVVPESAWLTFHHRYDFEFGYDGGVVEVESGGVWTPVEPALGYDVPNLPALGWSAGYSGRSNGWRVGRIDLRSYAGETVRVRFRAASDESVSAGGWQIDDVACVSYDLETSSAPGALGIGLPSSAAGALLAQPNPFRDAVDLSWHEPTPMSGSPTSPTAGAGSSDLSPPTVLSIFDSSGRTVRRIPVTGNHSQWDGRDDHGRALPSGVYWVQRRGVDGAAIAPGGGQPTKLVRIQ
ncbi:MAG: S8 family serine peptidase [Candidatus Eisenbacteria bacterium]